MTGWVSKRSCSRNRERGFSFVMGRPARTPEQEVGYVPTNRPTYDNGGSV